MDLLLPDRHPNRDFFIADIFDSSKLFKDDVASMEHPVFSLSTHPDMRVLEYEHRGNWIKIHPSGYGLATIFDKDILLYCGSWLMDRINAGEIPPQTIQASAHDMLVTTNRQTSGRGYELLEKALLRLRGTTIETNIKTQDTEIQEGFGLIDRFEIVRKDRRGRMISLQIKLSDWFYNALVGQEVLTISRDYFRLRRPLERRLYELGRKHCGNQEHWSVGMETLQRKVGTSAPAKKFTFNLRGIAKTNHLPHYVLEMGDNHVTFVNREVSNYGSLGNEYPLLRTDTFENARKVASGLDVYQLEQDWHQYWDATGRPPLKNADAAFVAFCKRRGKLASQQHIGDLFE